MYFGPMNGEVVLEDNNIVCIFLKERSKDLKPFFRMK